MGRWPSRAMAAALVGALAGGVGCSSGDDDDGSSEGAGMGAGMGGGAQPSAGAGSGAGASGSSAAGHAGSDHAGSGAGSGGGMSASGAGGNAGMGKAGSGTGSQFENAGVCGVRGEGTVTETAYMGFEEYYIISEEGFGEDICVVRFDVKRVGAAPDGCDDPAGDIDCLWTHTVELSNPKVMTDENGVCAKSDLKLDMAKIMSLTGSRVAYGFVSEFAGHNSVLMKYDEMKKAWDAHGMGNWDDESGSFRYDRRDGVCNY